MGENSNETEKGERRNYEITERLCLWKIGKRGRGFVIVHDTSYFFIDEDELVLKIIQVLKYAIYSRDVNGWTRIV
jgi:hypothetical protein